MSLPLEDSLQKPPSTSHAVHDVKTLVSALLSELQAVATEVERERLTHLLEAVRTATQAKTPQKAQLAHLPPALEDPTPDLSAYELAWWVVFARQEKEGVETIPAAFSAPGIYPLYVREHESTVRVFPRLAALFHKSISQEASWLASRLEQECPELRTLDVTVWEAVQQGNTQQAAQRWLRSPARRLLNGLPSLERELKQALDDPDQALVKAAGLAAEFPESHDLPRAAQETAALGVTVVLGLYASPSASSSPALPDHRIEDGLRALTQGASSAARGAALLKLLNRAVDAPSYEFEGMTRRLSEDLGLHIAAAESQWNTSSMQEALALEKSCLSWSSRLRFPSTSENSSSQTLERRWRMARWLHQTLSFSPYYGEDRLAQRLTLDALLRRAPSALETDDALSPHRCAAASFRLDALAQLSALVEHYVDPERERLGRRLLPMPLSLLHQLREIAAQTPSPEEEEAEEKFLDGHDRLGWKAPHVAPVWLARWILTRLGMTWWGLLPSTKLEPLMGECLRRLQERPEKYEWIAQAVQVELRRFPATLDNQLGQVWERVSVRLKHLPADAEERPPLSRVLLWLSTRRLSQLQEHERQQLLRALKGLEETWHASFFDQLLEGAEQQQLWTVWGEVAAVLLEQLQVSGASPRQREELIRRALVRIPSTRHPERERWLKQLLGVLSAPPYVQLPSVVRELRRYGAAGWA